MANYVLTTKTYGPGTLAAIVALMEAYIETIDAGKTIYRYDVYRTMGDYYEGLIVHAT